MRRFAAHLCAALWISMAITCAARAGEGLRRGGATSGRDTRMIEREVTVSATLPDVWRAWTTEEGVTSFGPKQASIDLRIGGKYEWYFQPNAPEGSRGSEGCTVLSYVPMRMVSFTWLAPRTIPKLRAAGPITHVVVFLEEIEPGKVKVRLTHVGFGVGDDWDKYYRYFERAWDSILSACKQKVSSKNASKQPEAEHVTLHEFLVFLEPTRATMFSGATNDERRLVVEHFKYLRGLAENDTVILAGTCQDGPPAIVVLAAEDQDAAYAIIDKDPALREGVFTAEVRPFKVSLLHRP